MKVSEQDPTTVIKDPTTAGILRTLDIEITPYEDKEKSRIYYRAKGDIKSALDKIAANYPVGCRDVLESIKACRSMIWVLKEGR